MSERSREIAGLVIAVVAVALIPIGWYFSRTIWIIAFVFAVAGLLLMFTKRLMKSERDIENTPSAYSPPVRPSVPGDVHNYSGWRDGGRSLGGGDSADGGGD
ncbi:MAG TPA: hypothetical protein VFR18_08080 [Terriglobia bacterium]|nr:hypothetical protein [Terriglobia bacterium]